MLRKLWGNYPRYEERVKVEYTRFSSRPLDRDNLYGSSKAWIDALVRCGVIVDDTEARIDLICRNEKGDKRTVIRLSPCD